MKQFSTNRNRAYYRHHRNRVINRKLGIIKHYLWNVKNDEYGRLAKGKIHCSCWWCCSKSHRLGFPKSEKVKIEAFQCQIADYFEENQ